MMQGMWMLWLVMGCGLSQSYGDGLRMLCAAPVHCDGCEAMEPAARAEAAVAWAEGELSNPLARKVLAKALTFEPSRRGGVLRAAASREDVRPCPLADLFDEAGS
jgi:hypothetical protein